MYVDFLKFPFDFSKLESLRVLPFKGPFAVRHAYIGHIRRHQKVSTYFLGMDLEKNNNTLELS